MRYCYEEETGFYYVSSRYYDPEVDRFISADTTEVLDVQSDLYDKNLYAYCDNNPIIRKDLSGKIWVHAAIIGVSGLIGGALGAFSAAQTGGDVVGGFIQGAAVGAISSFAGLNYTLIKGVVFSTILSGFVDGAMQGVSYYKKNGNLNSFKLKWKSILDTGFQSGVSTAIPYIGTGTKNIADVVATTMIWTQVSTVITCADVVYTNMNNKKKPDKDSYVYSNTRRTGRVPI